MSRPVRILLIAAALPVLIAAWTSVVFAMDRASNGGEVLGAVIIGDVDVSGLSRAEARNEVLRLEYRLATTPFPVDVDGTTFELMPFVVGFDLDEEAMLDAAMQNGREGGLTDQFRWWLGNFNGSDPITVPLIPAGWDPSALAGLLANWGQIAIDDLPFDGEVRFENGEIIAEYPRTGTGIDAEGGVAAIEPHLFGFERPPITVPTSIRVPTLTSDVIDAAVTEAEALIDGPVRLIRTVPDIQVEFPESVLADALRSRRVTRSDGTDAFEVFFDPLPLQAFLGPIRSEIEVPPQDAEIVIRPGCPQIMGQPPLEPEECVPPRDVTPTIIPGRTGVIIEEQAITAAVMNAAKSATRTSVLPFTDGAEPEFSTADAEALGIRYLLYPSVTFFPSGGPEKNLNRIQNIQRIAEEVDGAIVMPGETFSLNDYVGPRTLEDGYARAGAIIGDEVYCCDHVANIGGGVSQFTTTLYNAVFWSGLEDVEHTPHTLYFPRYPEGREATLGWPDPDLVFRNDTDFAILIDTDSTDESVTVRFFGDNGGREVDAELSPRRFYTEPHDKYKPNPEVPPGEEKITDEGSPGWTVTVYRTVTYPDGTVKEQNWDWRYDPFPKVIEVHPCQLPPDAEDYEPGVPCPVEAPNVGGMTVAEATATLNGAGIFIATGEPFLVSDPALVGTVRAQDPAPGTLVELESTVTVRVGQLDPNSTTTTTTTTAPAP